MTRANWFSSVAISWACLGMALPETVLAGEPANRRATPDVPGAVAPAHPTMLDVALDEGGVLKGQVVDPQGAGMAASMVIVRQQGRDAGQALTDANGNFSIGGLRGGCYEIGTETGSGVYRLWAPKTAPPAAAPGILVVSGQDVARGQMGGLRSWVANPWVLAGLLSAAIIVPIALSNRGKVSTS